MHRLYSCLLDGGRLKSLKVSTKSGRSGEDSKTNTKKPTNGSEAGNGSLDLLDLHGSAPPHSPFILLVFTCSPYESLLESGVEDTLDSLDTLNYNCFAFRARTHSFSCSSSRPTGGSDGIVTLRSTGFPNGLHFLCIKKLHLSSAIGSRIYRAMGTRFEGLQDTDNQQSDDFQVLRRSSLHL